MHMLYMQFEDEMSWDNNDNDEKEDTPYVHLWVPFKNIKQVYTVDNDNVTVTLDDLKNVDPNKWVEIPDDNLNLKITEIENQVIAVEFIIYSNDNSNQNDKDFCWPRGTTDNEWKNFKIGQIVDVKDTQHKKWYEAVIKKVITNVDENDEELIVHYIGWGDRYDEKVKGNDQNRVLNRHTHTKSPHRLRKSSKQYVFKSDDSWGINQDSISRSCAYSRNSWNWRNKSRQNQRDFDTW